MINDRACVWACSLATTCVAVCVCVHSKCDSSRQRLHLQQFFVCENSEKANRKKCEKQEEKNNVYLNIRGRVRSNQHERNTPAKRNQRNRTSNSTDGIYSCMEANVCANIEYMHRRSKSRWMHQCVRQAMSVAITSFRKKREKNKEIKKQQKKHRIHGQQHERRTISECAPVCWLRARLRVTDYYYILIYRHILDKNGKNVRIADDFDALVAFLIPTFHTVHISSSGIHHLLCLDWPSFTVTLRRPSYLNRILDVDGSNSVFSISSIFAFLRGTEFLRIGCI